MYTFSEFRVPQATLRSIVIFFFAKVLLLSIARGEAQYSIKETGEAYRKNL